MARHESDREELLSEAIALIRRAELAVPGEPEHVICGFHRDGRLSVYFGPDPVYHFDADGRLRRAYAGGRLYRTQGTTLARLTRVRTPAATELHRHDLNDEELAAFRESLRQRLARLADCLGAAATTTIQQIPPDDDRLRPDAHAVVSRILERGPELAPPITGKR
ncbi:MAG TPA: hypothetical protein VML55_21310 [Planctomycetaceae bacterium]|nr:hypothetical protein [Planctomycetaceae bacterium]